MFRKTLTLHPMAAAIGLVLAATSVQAQDAPKRATSALLEEVVVTARKREEGAQDVPLSVSALGSDQIEAMKVRDLTSLAVGMPNVALDEIGTTKGTANFSIRGLGVNSSIPSIDPTVGVFVDGVYLGLNNGIIFDTFDLGSIEVLRGPQGILFGRNVTGGAILMNSKRPGEEFEATIRAAVDAGSDGGYNKYLMGSVSGPLSDSFAAKVTAYYNDDDGWFENEFNGDDHGAIEQKMIRPSFVWSPTDTFDIFVKYEYSEIEGDGAAAQSHTPGPVLLPRTDPSDPLVYVPGVDGTPENFDRDDFEFSIDEKGYQTTETNLFSAEFNWQVGDNGTITNIFGWRDSEGDTLSDIDAQPVSLFHAPANTEAEQFSNELRYNTIIADKLNLTTGVYWFQNEIVYHERRNLLGLAVPGDDNFALIQDGGGEYEVETAAIFIAGDYDITDTFTLTAGLRYTEEEKEVKIASLSVPKDPCNVVDGTCPFDFADDEKWESWSPKLGGTWHINDDARMYAHWTRGFRSGGYNLRNTSGDLVNNGPGPFDEEQVDNYEIGFKTEFGRGRLNGALFYNEIQDMQREVNLPDPTAGVVQIIKNTADAEILGLELDGTFAVTDSFLLMASIGYVDPEYQDVFFDLNGDTIVDDHDKDLDLPRAAEWTYSLAFSWDVDISSNWYMNARGSYAHRDESAYNDNNRGIINEQDIIDAGLDFYSNNGSWVVGLYGKNLTDEAKHGGDTSLPATLGGVPLGGTFSPLAKGRHYGVEVTYNFY